MTIYIDADSCPRRIREIIIKASNKRAIPAIFVANRKIPDVISENTELIVIPGVEEAVDNYIIDHCRNGDIIVTRDIPLAARLLEQDVFVLNDRGTVFLRENIKERLSIRNFSKEVREAGLEFEAESSFGKKQVKAFSDTFSNILDRNTRNC